MDLHVLRTRPSGPVQHDGWGTSNGLLSRIAPHAERLLVRSGGFAEGGALAAYFSHSAASVSVALKIARPASSRTEAMKV